MHVGAHSVHIVVLRHLQVPMYDDAWVVGEDWAAGWGGEASDDDLPQPGYPAEASAGSPQGSQQEGAGQRQVAGQAAADGPRGAADAQPAMWRFARAPPKQVGWAVSGMGFR
jgi:hypothetical protein